jgi:hypothetical protein
VIKELEGDTPLIPGRDCRAHLTRPGEIAFCRNFKPGRPGLMTGTDRDLFATIAKTRNFAVDQGIGAD